MGQHAEVGRRGARGATRPTSDGFNVKCEICEKGRKNAKIKPN